jgi:acetyltransferase/esterase
LVTSGFVKSGDGGAELYFERRGVSGGAPLLMIAGGGGDCGFYAAIGDILADYYTVITYDRRGNSRSRLLTGPARVDLGQQSGDAIAVIRANGFDSARIFGSSGGATIALDLAARHPRAVESVIAHEPPTPTILPDAGEILGQYDEVDQILATRGWQEAFKVFLAINRLVPPGSPAAVTAVMDPSKTFLPERLFEFMKRQSGNWEYMMRYEVRSFVDYVPDLAAIEREGVGIALTAGVETGGQYFHRSSALIAERLGAIYAEFPGGHSGALEVPREFAVELRSLFERLSVPTIS